ncbi:subtilisin-like protein [Epithele typhae]|uniref:subtilisin-like protein n=1 Tax=Epithele typhae TaxID=378194 RepID=UPI00200781E4|nr:subtilisin-like protein [Epithele typhae]KAH9945171.1 subtilisin-like protein [Epithele typhae]
MLFFSSAPLGLIIALVSTLASTSAASTRSSPLLSRHVLHERGSIPPGWSLRRRADPDMTLPLRISLQQSNLHLLDDFLLDIADPDSPNYGRHWTAARVKETFRPADASVDAVRAWLAAEGIAPALSQDGVHLRVDLSVADAERLFAAKYYVYGHEESGEEHVACHHGYHLPEHIAEHVKVVTPTVQFGGITVLGAPGSAFGKRAPKTPAGPAGGIGRVGGGKRTKRPMEAMASMEDLANCDVTVFPDCIRALYNFNYTFQDPEHNSIAVVELEGQTYLPDDLTTFFKKFAPGRVGQEPTLVSFDGGHTNFSETDINDIGESNMDFMLVMGLTPPEQQVQLYQLGGEDPFDAMLAGFDASFCDFKNATETYPNLDCGNKPPPAYVVSISYGGVEDLFGQAPFSQQACAEFAKLSLLGVTFVVSSGDDGVASALRGSCVLPDGSLGTDSGAFTPSFPASCPYVLSVGSTQIDVGAPVSAPESATTAFFSGGGFSNLFPRPRYQRRAAARFLAAHDPGYGPGVFNRTGRGIPDVAANGWNTTVVLDGAFANLGGTSASAPVFASMLAAVNDARGAAGKGPVGFVNPALYSHLFAGVYHDVVNGSNPGCGTGGFEAVEGWDPVTGLGTVDFEKMLSRFMLLP